MELSGKVAFITGSGNGIGKGYAEALLEKGSKVFLSDINEEVGAETLVEFQGKYGKDKVRFMKLDAGNEKQIEEVFNAAVAAFGHIDIMVNNAGVMNEAIWQIMIQVNFLGLVKGTKLAEEHMRKDKGGRGGRIINISSIRGLVDKCTVPVYSGTKSAVRSYTISQAGQYDIDKLGVEYAVLCPNPTDTDLINKLDDSKMLYLDEVKGLVYNTMPVTRVVEAFMDLVQLENMNGAILYVTKERKAYQTMERVDLGTTYKSAVVR